MNLFLLEHDASVEELVKFSSYREDRDVIVCVNYLVKLALERRGHRGTFLFIDELFSESDYTDLHREADRLAMEWYKDGGNDLSLLDGISYGDIVQICFARTYFLPVLIKYGDAVRLAKHRWPDVNTVVGDFSDSHNTFLHYLDDAGRVFSKRRLIEVVARQLNLACAEIVPISRIPNVFTGRIFAEPAAPVSVVAPLASPGPALRTLWSFTVRENALRGLRFLKRMAVKLRTSVKATARKLAKKIIRKKVYFFYSSVLASLLDHLDPRFLLSIDLPGEEAILFEMPVKASPMTPETENVLENLRKLVLRQTGNGFFRVRGIDYGDVYLPALHEILERLLPLLITFTVVSTQKLQNAGICTTVVNDVVDHKNRLFARLAEKLGIKTILLDHGLMGNRPAMRVALREKIDYYISTETFDPYDYARRGVPLVPLGSPCMDPYPAQKRKKVTQIKRILILSFAADFYDRLDRFAYREKYLEQAYIFAGAMVADGCEVMFRPHPSERRDYHEYVMNFFSVPPESVRMDGNQTFTDMRPFSELIYDMDLLICGGSTSYYEGLAAGVPTIFFEPSFVADAALAPFNGVHGKDILRFEDGAELAGFIREQQRDMRTLQEFFENFMKTQGSYFMGDLDGKAGQRVAKFARAVTRGEA